MPPKDFPATLWGRLLERYGIPTVLLCALLYWGGHASDRVAQWIATDVAAPLIRTHVETLQTLQQTQREIVKTQQETAKAQQDTAKAVGQIERTIERCCDPPTKPGPSPTATAVASPQVE